ncbi:MAG TPA: hypothetical protein VLH38_01365 [Patescibacteria group bacterium]|nr:hypothetical protein [Patescibacteria group bacterium]
MHEQEARAPQLTIREELKNTLYGLATATLGWAGECVNDNVHSFRGGPLGNWNPAEHIGNVGWSVIIGMTAYAATQTLETSNNIRTASLALALGGGLACGFVVNAAWETDSGSAVTAHIPERAPLIGQLNSKRHTADPLDLWIGTIVSGLTAVDMARRRHSYLQKRKPPIYHTNT